MIKDLSRIVLDSSRRFLHHHSSGPPLSLPQKNNGKNIRAAILGIYLNEQKNTVKLLCKQFSKNNYHDVEQYWAHLGDGEPHGSIAPYVKIVQKSFVPKMILLNSLLKYVDLNAIDYIIVSDDDIIIPRNFLDSFLSLQRKFDLALAQPARTRNSWVSHEITRQVSNIQGRLTRFVESGPLFSIHTCLFRDLLPFDTLSPMGWGLEYVWAFIVQKKSLRMGIIDAVAIDHSLRKPHVTYQSIREEKRMNELLALREHIPPEEAKVTISILQ